MDKTLLISCLVIFLGRIFNVSIGTIRIIFIGKERQILAFLFSFFEVLIWFLIVRTALQPDAHIFIGIAYSLGYAVGTSLGMILTKYFVKGTVGLQVITSSKNDDMVNALREQGFGLSVVDIKGKDNIEKYMLLIEVSNKKYDKLVKSIKKLDPKAFIVANESKMVINGYIK
jgi:uncharacterized protein YebE (UPF0316 family)